jgi:hypothetical protein
MFSTSLLCFLLCVVLRVDALTCQLYDSPPKCVSIGCDVHCQAIGKQTGYCSLNSNSCVCNCVGHKRNQDNNHNVTDDHDVAQSQSHSYDAAIHWGAFGNSI